MNYCEICRCKESTLWHILPLAQPNGSLVTLACNECTVKSEAFCAKHAITHMGFVHNTHACTHCIDELVARHRATAAVIQKSILAHIPAQDAEEVREHARMLAACSESQAASDIIVRMICTSALRFGYEYEELIEEIRASRSAKMIFGVDHDIRHKNPPPLAPAA